MGFSKLLGNWKFKLFDQRALNKWVQRTPPKKVISSTWKPKSYKGSVHQCAAQVSSNMLFHSLGLVSPYCHMHRPKVTNSCTSKGWFMDLWPRVVYRELSLARLCPRTIIKKHLKGNWQPKHNLQCHLNTNTSTQLNIKLKYSMLLWKTATKEYQKCNTLNMDKATKIVSNSEALMNKSHVYVNKQTQAKQHQKQPTNRMINKTKKRRGRRRRRSTTTNHTPKYPTPKCTHPHTHTWSCQHTNKKTVQQTTTHQKQKKKKHTAPKGNQLKHTKKSTKPAREKQNKTAKMPNQKVQNQPGQTQNTKKYKTPVFSRTNQFQKIMLKQKHPKHPQKRDAF